MTSNRTFFDATVDFEVPGQLETELAHALESLTFSRTDAIGLHIPADGEDCELGEIVAGNAEFSRDVRSDDWVALCAPAGTSAVQALARDLRALMAG